MDELQRMLAEFHTKHGQGPADFTPDPFDVWGDFLP